MNPLAPLDRTGWLSRQSPEFREWIARNGRWHHYSARQVLYDVGDAPDGIYGLGEGALEISLPVDADEPVLIHRAEPGFWIGESALFAGAPRAISIAAAIDTRIFFVPAPALRKLVSERPQAWEAFYQLSHINATNAALLLAEALALSPRARLSRVVLRLAGGDGWAEVRQDDLARLLGMTRSSLQRALASLIEARAITTGYGRIDIADRAALERISRET